MALFPITAYYTGDFIPHLVAVDTDDSMDQVAKKVVVHTLGRRLPALPGDQEFDVFLDGERIEPDRTLGTLGLEPLQWLDVKPRA